MWNLRGGWFSPPWDSASFTSHSAKTLLHVCVNGTEGRKTPGSWRSVTMQGAGQSLALHSHGPSVWELAKASLPRWGSNIYKWSPMQAPLSEISAFF